MCKYAPIHVQLILMSQGVVLAAAATRGTHFAMWEVRPRGSAPLHAALPETSLGACQGAVRLAYSVTIINGYPKRGRREGRGKILVVPLAIVEDASG